MSADVFAAAIARAEAATGGPWVPQNATLWEQHDPEPADWWVWQESKLPYYGGVAHVENHDPDKPGGVVATEISDAREPEREKADAEFIAHARDDVPAFAASLQRVRERHHAENQDRIAVCTECTTEEEFTPWPCDTWEDTRQPGEADPVLDLEAHEGFEWRRQPWVPYQIAGIYPDSVPDAILGVLTYWKLVSA